MYNDYATVGLGSAATHNKEDHAEVKRLVSAAGAYGWDKAGYDDVLAKAFTAFDTHAREEETDQHPTLRQKLSAQDSDVRAGLLDDGCALLTDGLWPGRGLRVRSSRHARQSPRRLPVATSSPSSMRMRRSRKAIS